jgi:trigger factor
VYKRQITVDAETFEKANHSAYLKSRSKINVPGFRKGKAPKAVILQRYGEGVFYEDAFDEVFPLAYQEAILEHDIKPVERPAIDILEIGPEGVKFTCEVTVMPEVKLGDYKGVEIEAPEYNVTEKQVDAQIQRECEKIARWVEVEREVKKGDRATIDYKGFVDDVAFEGGEAEGHPLEIGSGSFIPGFEDQIIGMKKGEQKDIMVTFPEQYHSEELKGKEAKFEVTVHEIKEKELPELDDEFAKDVSEFDTLNEYKEDIKTKLQEQADARTESEIENLLIERIAQNSEVDIPQPMIEREIDFMVNDMQRRMRYQGIDMEEYLRLTNTELSTLREQFKNDAEMRVKTGLVLEEIQKAENFDVTDEEIDNELEQIAKSGNQSVEDIKKTLTPDNISYLRESVLNKKTVQFLKDNAVLKVKTEKKTEEKENKED